MKTKIFYLITFLSLLASCNTKPKDFKKGLPLIIFKIEDNTDVSDSSGNRGLVIRFYENGTYSHFGYNFFAYGNWHWNEEKKTITLNPTTSKDSNFTQQFKIEKKYDNSYSIKKIIVRDGKTLVQRYENKAIGLNTSTGNDPFNKEINVWRIKPAKSESTQEIKTRTLNYLQFLLTYYEFIEENKINILTYGWYATPIQMHYANGARMTYNTELADWYACFYSIDEANEAYKLIGKAMRKSKIKELESKAERNIDYLKQMIEALK